MRKNAEYTYNIIKPKRNLFMGRLIIDGNRIYEVDELCLKRKKEQSGAEANRKPAPKQAGQGNGHTENKR